MKRITDLRWCECRWPVGGSGDQHLFCSAPTPEGSSYCATHRRLAYGRKPVPLLRQIAVLKASQTGYGDPEPVPPHERLDLTVAEWIEQTYVIQETSDEDD